MKKSINSRLSEYPIPRVQIDLLQNSNVSPPAKLIEHCTAINDAFRDKHYMACAILIRAILDYIPTIFGFRTVEELKTQSKKKRTLKSALGQIELAIRNIADDALHNPAKRFELVKITKKTIDNQTSNLLVILDEVCTQLRTDDLRDFGNAKIRQRKDFEIVESKTQLEVFDQYIRNEKWYKEHLNDKEVWICEKDNLFQIHKQHDYEDFSEPWTQVFPDKKGSGKYSVDLIYNGSHIKRLTFIYCDGGRINVVLPSLEKNTKNDWEGKDIFHGSYKNIGYFWITSSLDVHLTRLIGSFYIYKTLEGVAAVSNIDVRK